MGDLLKVVIWLMLLGPVTGILAAILAQAKGRSGMMGFGAGVLCGAFGLILVAVLPSFKVEERQSRERMRRPREITPKGADERHGA